MKITEVTDLKNWNDYKDDWQKLQDACKLCHPFLDWNWIRPWADYLSCEQKRPILLIIKNQHNDVVGIAPFQINKKGLYRYIEGFAQEFADYIDWLYRPDFKKEVGRIICEWLLKKRRHYDYIRIFNILPGGLPHKALTGLCPDNIRQHSIASHIEINGTYDDSLKTLKPKFLSDTRRRERKLSREMGEIEYFVVKDSQEISGLLDYVKVWLDVRRKEKNEASYFDRQGMINHLVILYQKLFSLGMLHFSGLRVNNSVAVLNIAFKYNNSLFSYTPVSDPDLKKYSLIRLLKFRHLEECYVNGLILYDFCLGGENYKFKFNPVVKQLYRLTLHCKTVRGHLIKLYDTSLKQIIGGSKYEKWLKKKLRILCL